MKLTVEQLAQRLDAETIGDSTVEIQKVEAMAAADAHSVTFVTKNKHISELRNSNAGAVIVSSRIADSSKPQLIVKNVNSALIDVLTIFAPPFTTVKEGIDPTATIGADVRIAKGVFVGPGVVLEDSVSIGENSVIEAGAKICEGTRIGKNCRIGYNVVIYHHCCIGNNVIIQANSTIGSTGFGYCLINGSHQLIPHNGGVVIEDFVEIGTNTSIDRAKFGNTVIGAGTKIDNLVQIAHNVIIGKCCLIVAQVGIAGSCKIGDGVVLAGQAGVADNIEIGDGSIIGGQSGVTKNIDAGKRCFGSPAIDFAEEAKIIVLRKRLPKFAETITKLSERVERLEASKDDKK